MHSQALPAAVRTHCPLSDPTCFSFDESKTGLANASTSPTESSSFAGPIGGPFGFSVLDQLDGFRVGAPTTGGEQAGGAHRRDRDKTGSLHFLPSVERAGENRVSSAPPNRVNGHQGQPPRQVWPNRHIADRSRPEERGLSQRNDGCTVEDSQFYGRNYMATEVKNFDSPDETRPFEGKGQAKVVQLAGHAVAEGTFEPGWKWSENVKPIAGTDSCQVAHFGYVLSGSMRIYMDDGSETE